MDWGRWHVVARISHFTWYDIILSRLIKSKDERERQVAKRRQSWAHDNVLVNDGLHI